MISFWGFLGFLVFLGLLVDAKMFTFGHFLMTTLVLIRLATRFAKKPAVLKAWHRHMQTASESGHPNVDLLTESFSFFLKCFRLQKNVPIKRSAVLK